MGLLLTLASCNLSANTRLPTSLPNDATSSPTCLCDRHIWNLTATPVALCGRRYPTACRVAAALAAHPTLPSQGAWTMTILPPTCAY